MSTTSEGRHAEDVAAKSLREDGYDVLEQNWRTRWCEIDIVASKDGIVRFVEVKYRRKAFQGSGLEYVTPTKQRQMAFAAEFWVAKNNWQGEYALAAIEVSGTNFEVTAFLEDIY